MSAEYAKSNIKKFARLNKVIDIKQYRKYKAAVQRKYKSSMSLEEKEIAKAKRRQRYIYWKQFLSSKEASKRR